MCRATSHITSRRAPHCFSNCIFSLQDEAERLANNNAANDNGAQDEGVVEDDDEQEGEDDGDGAGFPHPGAGGTSSEDTRLPLQLPFSTVGISRGGARLAHMVVELRKITDLDLFRVPGTATSLVTNNNSGSGSNGAAASLFDADALGDELEEHEKRLQEFDDFLADFTDAGNAVDNQQ